MIRLLIVDDHPIVREGVRSRLADAPDIAIIGVAQDGEEAMKMARRDNPTLALLDISLPGMNGLDVLRQLQAEMSEVRVVMLTTHSETQYAVRCLRLGAWGYLTKNSPSEELVKAIRLVNQGHKYFGASLAQQLASELGTSRTQTLHEQLSDREFQILCFLTQGKTVSQVADILSISTSTVGTHRAHILDKMNMNTTAELVKYAVEHNLVDF